MSTGPIRWGIMSAARIARRSVGPGIHKARNGELRAVASRSLERARGIAAELEIPRAYGSYEALLADPEIDAVYIPLPTSLHHEWVIAAARAGKHVLVDKPFAVDAAEAVEMVDACRAAGVQLLEGFMYRYDPKHARLRELVRRGRLATCGRSIRRSVSRSPETRRTCGSRPSWPAGRWGTWGRTA